MSVRIHIDLPDDAFAALRSSPDEFAAEMRLAAAVKWYEQGRVSQSRAAELAGVTRAAFLQSLARFEVSPFQTTPEELRREVGGS